MVDILSEQEGRIFTVIANSCCFNGHLGMSILTQIPLAHIMSTIAYSVIIVLLIFGWNHSIIILQDCNVSALLNCLPTFSHYRYSFARDELRCLRTILSYSTLSRHTGCPKLLGLLLRRISVS